MNNQQLEYYTPDIEDIHIGYECERESNYGRWYKDIIEEIQLTSSDNPFQKIISDVANKALRVPYLNAEQLEKEGWKLDFSRYVTPGVVLCKGDYTVWIWSGDIKLIWIRGKNDESLFKGECKSINEFRKICKMLNINGK